MVSPGSEGGVLGSILKLSHNFTQAQVEAAVFDEGVKGLVEEDVLHTGDDTMSYALECCITLS